MDGDIAVVGDPHIGVGTVWVYRFLDSRWSLEAELHSAEPGAEDFFGWVVAIDGNVLAVGAPLSDATEIQSGAVDVFRYDGAEWKFEARLTGSDDDFNDTFGLALDISGDVIVAGARNHDLDSVFTAGAAYVFRWNGRDWVQEAKLVAPDPVEEAYFGDSVAISGDWIVVGATGNEEAFVFRFDGITSWTLDGHLTPSSTTIDSRFGASAAIGGGRVAVGAHQDGQHGSSAGAVFSYARSDRWIEQEKILASDGGPGDHFGRAIAMNDDGLVLVVGAPIDDDLGFWSGSAYVFRMIEDAWSERTKLLPADGGPGLRFADDVCIDGDWAIFGAFESAYLFAGMIDIDCNDNGDPDSCDILLGESADRNHDGIPDECHIADIDADGDVDWKDLVLLLSDWGRCEACRPDCKGDIDGDCLVSLTDLLVLLDAWSH